MLSLLASASTEQVEARVWDSAGTLRWSCFEFNLDFRPNFGEPQILADAQRMWRPKANDRQLKTWQSWLRHSCCWQAWQREQIQYQWTHIDKASSFFCIYINRPNMRKMGLNAMLGCEALHFHFFKWIAIAGSLFIIPELKQIVFIFIILLISFDIFSSSIISMRISGSQNGGTVPYKAIFWVYIPLYNYIALNNRPYIW